MMSNVRTMQGDLTARSARVGIAIARFNEFIGTRLLDGAMDILTRHGVDTANIEVVKVPGAFELPLAVKIMAERGHYDALIALGCVVRGATPHFDYVAGSCVQGLARVSLEATTPVGFGVLTVDTIEQAIERAGTKAGNKGADAALAALEMVSLIRQFET